MTMIEKQCTFAVDTVRNKKSGTKHFPVSQRGFEVATRYAAVRGGSIYFACGRDSIRIGTCHRTEGCNLAFASSSTTRTKRAKKRYGADKDYERTLASLGGKKRSKKR